MFDLESQLKRPNRQFLKSLQVITQLIDFSQFSADRLTRSIEKPIFLFKTHSIINQLYENERNLYNFVYLANNKWANYTINFNVSFASVGIDQ